jgi:hypothetical protein
VPEPKLQENAYFFMLEPDPYKMFKNAGILHFIRHRKGIAAKAAPFPWHALEANQHDAAKQ